MSAAARAVPSDRSSHHSPGTRKPAAVAHVAGHSQRKRFLSKPNSYDPNKGPDNNWTRVPHTFWAMAGREIFSGIVQMAVIGYIMARTWGDNAKPASTRITLSDFVRELKFSERMIVKVLADAIRRQLIAVAKSGQDREYRLLAENWEKAEKYSPSLDPESADDSEGEDDDEEELIAASTKCDPAVVMPGARSRCTSLRFIVKGHAEPVELKLDYKNDLPDYPYPVSFETSGGPKGRFSVTLRKAETPVENARVAPETTELQFRGRKGESGPQLVENPEVVQIQARDGSSPPSTDVESYLYRQYTTSLLLNHWGQALDEGLLTQIRAAAGDAPVEYFKGRARPKLDADRQHRHRPGLLVSLAADAKKDFDAVETKNELARAATRDRSAAGVSSDPQAALREHALSDPADYEKLRASQLKLGARPSDWPTLEELGVNRA